MRVSFTAIAILFYLFVYSASATTHVRVMGEYVPGELIVQFKKGANSKTLRGLATSVLDAQSLAGRPGLQRVRVSKNVDLRLVAQKIELDSNVAFAEPNYRVQVLDGGAPNDPLFSSQWALHNVGQPDDSGQPGKKGADLHVLPVWAKGIIGSKKVVVAVIDTGVDTGHPDLVANIYTNPGEVSDNGIDDEKNGYIDDVHGWNTITDTGNSKDDFGHGTHCAGIIGAVGGNGIGISGINHQVSILPVKFISADGQGSMADAIKAIEYARKMKVNVMSNSWGGSEASKALQASIEDAKKEGILFVAAAGNGGEDVGQFPLYPAAFPVANVMSVAATDNQDRLTGFSNYGKGVHIAAPGLGIMSTVPGGYESDSGTSMAAPHVAGVAALMLSVRGDLSVEQLKQTLIDTADPLTSSAGKELNAGRLNVERAIQKIQ